jgi:6-phosphogluconolactonase (cycloisomerase 2 family)
MPEGSRAGTPAVEGVAGVGPCRAELWRGVGAPAWYRSGVACLCVAAVAIALVVLQGQVLGAGPVTHGPARVAVLRNTLNGMRASVSDGRFAVSGAHGLRLGLSSLAVGRGSGLRTVTGLSAPSVHGNVVRLAGPAITEWFMNRASGVEQGFTLTDRPAGSGALVISQEVSGNAAGRAEAGGSAVTFSSSVGVLRYDDLVVTDAHGNRLPARLGVRADRLTITIADAHAVYPLRVDPVMVTPVTQSPASNADTGLNPVSVAFSPGGGLLATSNVEDSSVSMFSVNDATGALTPLGQTLSGGAFAYGVAFSPDGSLLATANSSYGCAPTCENGSVSTFQVGGTGTLTLASTAGAGMQPQSVTFTPNGLFLATANVYSNSVSVFQVGDAGTLTPVTQNPASNATTGSTPYSATFSPSGGLLAVPNDSSPGTVSIFQVNDTTGALTPVIQSPASNADGGGLAAAFSPDGGLLAVVGSAALSMFEVNETTGALNPVAQTSAVNSATAGATGVAFNAGGALLATSNVSGTVSLFQVNATGVLTEASTASTGGASSDPFGVAFSPCGGLLATVTEEQGTMPVFAISGDSAATLLPGCTSATSGGAGGTGGSGGSGGSGSGSGGPTGPPVETTAPTISGTADAHHTLTCSTGTWSNDPTRFAYQWYRDGTPIQGATASTYVVKTGDEQLTLTCSVTASNVDGAGSSATSAKTAGVAVPHVAKCPSATGTLAGITLGLVRLGMTRVQARHAYTRSSNRGKRYQDFFCLTPIGVRVGYASAKLLATVPKRERKSLAGRVIWASTASAYYAANGIRVGATVGAAGKALKLTGPIKIGANDWYVSRERSSTIVLKVRSGLIQEVGIGDRALTVGAKAQRNFLESFS